MEKETGNEHETGKIEYNVTRYFAYRNMFYNQMLIEQSDTWLSAEEGNRNMMKAIEQRRRAANRAKWRRLVRMIARIFKLKTNS
jgi:hypothetical protein